MSFGQRVKALREERGWTQAELARRAGLTHETISNYERDSRVRPPLFTVQAIARALEVPLADLLDDDAQPTALTG